MHTSLLPLYALGFMACHPRVDAPDIDSAVMLGWRLSTGMDIAYRYVTVLSMGGDTVSRKECWKYLVRSVDGQGAYALEGLFVSLNAGIYHDDRPLPESIIKGRVRTERDRLASGPVRLTLSMDGRVEDLETNTWSDTLVHRLLALQLPTAPVQAGAQWMDPSSARPFAHPIPSSVPITITGTQRLVSIVLVKDRKSERPKLLHPPPHVRATIETSAAVLPADARFPALDIEGRADWNLASGVLEHRSLEVRERGGEGSGEPSTLFLEGWYVPEGSRPY